MFKIFHSYRFLIAIFLMVLIMGAGLFLWKKSPLISFKTEILSEGEDDEEEWEDEACDEEEGCEKEKPVKKPRGKGAVFTYECEDEDDEFCDAETLLFTLCDEEGICDEEGFFRALQEKKIQIPEKEQKAVLAFLSDTKIPSSASPKESSNTSPNSASIPSSASTIPLQKKENQHGVAAQKTLPTEIFSDVSDVTPHAEAIVKVKELGIMQGSPDPKNPERRVFKEDSNMNRAELAAVVTRWLFPKELEGVKLTKTCRFSDVPKHEWFFPNITVACMKKLVKGYPDKTFKPDASINHVEALKIIVESAGQFSKETVGKVLAQEKKRKTQKDKWYLPYLRTAEKTKMLAGNELQVLKSDPAGFATRGWVAQVIANIPNL